ncbi:MAG TPA: lysoplasmalogenase [Kofleriaceae bacterium]|nr:lysoplasmalogenase [Kofleriaceae bacterium]
MIAFTVICALACAALVAGEYRDDNRLRYVAKPLASLAFIAVGITAASRGPVHEFEMAVLAGLVLGALGDVALLSAHGFLAGLGSFLLGHLAYAVAVGQYLPLRTWPHAAGPYAVIPIVVGLGVLAWLWPKLGSLRLPVIAYVAVILAMVVAAIALVRSDVAGMDAVRRERFALGAVLFFASDLAVARDKFVAKGFVNRAWGLPVYYAGQLLIAWSLLA